MKKNYTKKWRNKQKKQEKNEDQTEKKKYLTKAKMYEYITSYQTVAQ